MTRTTRGARRWLAVVAIATLVLAACGGGRDDEAGPGDRGDGEVAASPGITDTQVTFGGIYPFSGPASAYGTIGKAASAFFKHVNEDRGGVKMGDGKTRQVVFNTQDDGYVPARALENAKRLVEQEKVFGLFNTLGTPSNTAIWDYTNQQEVPQVFVATGASKWGSGIDEHPWTTGWQPAYTTESAVYAEYLNREKPNAKVAVLMQNDDYGKDYVDGFKAAIEGTSITIVAEETYEVTDPTVDSQVTNLSRSSADTFFNVTTPKFAAQAIKKAGELGWKPLHLLNSVSNSRESVLKQAGLQHAQGIVSAAYLKDPSDPRWANDAALNDMKQALAKHDGSINPNDPFAVYAWSVGETLVKALEKTEEPTREAFMEAVRSLDTTLPLVLPGVRVKTDGKDDGYPIESMQVQRFAGEAWELQGEVINFEGKTPHPEG